MTELSVAGAAGAEDSRQLFRRMAVIGVATASGSMSFDFWYPFMPLYLLKVGATSDANALFWIAVATTVQGICRILTGPLWGVLSDRIGRKLMLIRALYLAVPTILIAAFVTAPWQMAIALGFQGLFSGFIPAAVALASVSVPETSVGTSLTIVAGCQYLGTTVGPSIGAALAVALGYRGAILIASALPAIGATGVLFLVPRDRVATRPTAGTEPRPRLEPFHPTLQLVLLISTFFIITGMTQLIRLATPIAIKDIHPRDVNSIAGLVFSLGGLSSAIGVLAIAPRFMKGGTLARGLTAACALGGAVYLLLALTRTLAFYVSCFTAISLLQAAMIPATNTLIARNAPRSRRGTAFGWAGSAQAVGFIAGPLGAALFGAISLYLGFAVLGALMLALAGVLLLSLREPPIAED